MHEQLHQPEQPEQPERREQSGDHETTPPHEQPRIWVASLADYTNGHLHGEWIDAAREPEAIYRDIRRLLADSIERGAEEWAIFDYEHFNDLRIGEYESIETVAVLARAIVEHGEPFAAWVREIGIEEATADSEAFSDAYIGHFESEAAFAEEMWDDLGFNAKIAEVLPEDPRTYITVDYAGWARDLELTGDITTQIASDGGVYVFRTQ